MNNDNFNKLNFFSHDMITNLNKIGHDILSTTIENSLPIINTVANTNLKNLDYEPINYYLSKKNNKVFIMCEIPGLKKENCRVNYADKILRIIGETNFDEEWSFISKKNYYREIDVGFISKSSIKVKHTDGCLFISIDSVGVDDETNIDIE